MRAPDLLTHRNRRSAYAPVPPSKSRANALLSHAYLARYPRFPNGKGRNLQEAVMTPRKPMADANAPVR